MILDDEQIYHLIDLLEINIKEDKPLLTIEQKKESDLYDNDIIKVLSDELNSRTI